MDYVIRPLTTADEPILWEMLYQALQRSESEPAGSPARRASFRQAHRQRLAVEVDRAAECPHDADRHGRAEIAKLLAEDDGSRRRRDRRQREGRPGDTGFVAYDAEQNDKLLGAVWLRLPMGDQSGESEITPELAFTVKSGLRRRGIGAALLTQLVKANPQYSAISIRAPANNPAVRLYEKFGFKIVQQSEGTVTMRREV